MKRLSNASQSGPDGSPSSSSESFVLQPALRVPRNDIEDGESRASASENRIREPRYFFFGEVLGISEMQMQARWAIGDYSSIRVGVHKMKKIIDCSSQLWNNLNLLEFEFGDFNRDWKVLRIESELSDRRYLHDDFVVENMMHSANCP